MENERREVATLGGGCFWCVEAVFQDLRGVESVVSGYSGGHAPNPSYERSSGLPSSYLVGGAVRDALLAAMRQHVPSARL